MKKNLYLPIICLLMLIPFAGVKAQSPDSPDSTVGEITVISSEGRPVVSITKDGYEQDGFSISLAGVEIGFGTKSGFHKVEPLRDTRSAPARKPRRHYRGYLGILEFGFNGLASPDYKLYPAGEKDFLDLNNAKSTFVAVNLFKASKGLNRAGTIGFTAGIGITMRDYVFDNNISIMKGADGMIHPYALDRDYKKSKLSTFSFTVPLMLEFSSRPFFFSAGVYGDMVVGTHTKYKKPKHKDKSSHNVGMFHAGLSARIGFKGVYVFGNYGLTPLFKKDKGPETNPFSFGVGFGF